MSVQGIRFRSSKWNQRSQLVVRAVSYNKFI